MSRPLYYDTSGGGIDLREMTDADLDNLVYYLQVKYADQLLNSGKGYIFTGSGGTSIGSHQDTLSGTDFNETPSPGDAPGTEQYPAYPDLPRVNGITYNYRQDRTVPSFPSAGTLGTDSYMCLDGSYDIKVAKDESDIISGVINVALSEIKSGNLIGSYKVQENSPGTNWTDRGTWFIDTTFDDTDNTTYKLWLKTNSTSGSPPSSDVVPLKLFSNNLRTHSSITDTSDLVTNVLLPTLTRRLSTGTSLCYEVVSSDPGVGVANGNRGEVRNKEFQTVRADDDLDRTITGSGASQVYRSTSVPLLTAGSLEVHTRRWLKYLG